MMGTTEKQTQTVSMHFVNAAVRHLLPPARDRMLLMAGVPSGLLELPNARVPATVFSALWLGVARELNDEFFGLDRRAMKVGSFALLSQAAISCADLDGSLKHILRGFSAFLDDIQGEVRLEGADALLRITTRIDSALDRRFAEETLLILVHGLMCWLAGFRIPLSKVEFAHERPPYADEYGLMYCENIRFCAPQTCMHFEGRWLAFPVVQNASTLRAFLRTAPQSVFLKYRDETSWVARVRRHLRDSAGVPETWPMFEEFASKLGVTPTTLRRRLGAEGASYQAIKDRLRNDLAIDWLCNSDLSIDDIGARVGFNDASAFHRAFKRWNGLRPGEYRSRQGGGGSRRSGNPTL